MLDGRELQRDEIETVWSIDRSEWIENVYALVDGELLLRPDPFDLQGWPAGEQQCYTPLLAACYERGGWFYGLFDEARLVAVAALENKLIGARHDLLQLKFLQVSRPYRGQGLGKRLFELAAGRARAQGAGGLYVSATPSEHTIDFYLRRGCRLIHEPDPELWALEPEDIHLECML